MKKGDTLIEVTIAIGIFSFIAIGVASVMSSGVAGSQSALETTLAREEIDAQAEALRFIHEAYISNKGTGSNPYAEIWKSITSNAVNGTDVGKYNPTDCATPYETNALASKKAFILNPRNLNNSNGKPTYISFLAHPDKFSPTSTYPRLLFGGSADTLVENDLNTNLSGAEGIYVIAVKDSGTDIVGVGTIPAFYDFYIRTCWYGLDSETPSTISTVIRLYNSPTVN